MEQRLPKLIQRIRFRKEPYGRMKGVDKFFDFDYMGSAEFEFGALPKALKIMREARTKDWKVTKLAVGVDPASTNLAAFFVGHPDDLPIAEALLRDQLQKCPKHYTKEITSIRVSYGLDEPFGYGVYDGWWAVDAGRWTPHGRPATDSRPFVIFREKEHAGMWLKVMGA